MGERVTHRRGHHQFQSAELKIDQWLWRHYLNNTCLAFRWFSEAIWKDVFHLDPLDVAACCCQLRAGA